MELYQLNRYNTIMKNLSFILLFILLFTACSKSPSPRLQSFSYGDYEEGDFMQLPHWEKEDYLQVLQIYKNTCIKTKKVPLFEQTCLKVKQVDETNVLEARIFFENNFTPFKAISKNSLATGYFEPLLLGSLQKSTEFPYPLYGVPTDLLKVELSSTYKKKLSHPLRGRLVEGRVKPYFTREEIDADALATFEPICYVNDKVDLFFLQIQGSGCIRLEDGSVINVGYGDQNGFPYVSIGSEMIKKGLLTKEEVSLERIRSYLYANPEQVDEILHLNPSYIFFQPRHHSASGALGVVLQAERSVAVDKKNIPLGMPIFISTKDPLSQERFERVMFAHDTGGAIKGESRIDIFYGNGKIAEQKAGHMKNAVQLWLLVPNDFLSDEKVESKQ